LTNDAKAKSAKACTRFNHGVGRSVKAKLSASAGDVVTDEEFVIEN
jgi:hypothetical protein